jgi:hypothetical protein
MALRREVYERHLGVFRNLTGPTAQQHAAESGPPGTGAQRLRAALRRRAALADSPGGQHRAAPPYAACLGENQPSRTFGTSLSWMNPIGGELRARG